MEKQFLSLIFVTILAGASLSMVAMRFDPSKIHGEIKLLFFFSLFTFLWGAGTLAFFVLNIANGNRWSDSFRRGLFLSVLFLILVFFKRQEILSWYVGAIIGGIFIAAEIWIYKRLDNQANVSE
ncbi:MAG: hypothetical protein Q8R55_01745 [Candidatus Taylorbacteria bacterium]|nr:hypothetical protein [Candidatus Taylorbacteria bacterium]